MKKRNLIHNSSGQALVITALLVAVLLMSTAIYVIESEKNVPLSKVEIDNLPAYQQAMRHTLISALADTTNGSDPSILAVDLNNLESAITSNAYQALTQITFTPLNAGSYVNGIWISWGADGQGVSSAYVTLDVNATSTSSTSSSECYVNVTSALCVSGSYAQINATINLSINVLNEGTPALAQNFAFYVENASSWVLVNSPSINDFGNGTYTVSFTAGNLPPNPVVSTVCWDQRGIVVGANVTCTSMQ